MSEPAASTEGRTRPGSPLRRLTALLTSALGSHWSLVAVAVAIGLAGGLGAVFFRSLIDLILDLVWGPGGTTLEKFQRAAWYWRLAIPAGGGLLVGLLVFFFAAEARGHGVPEVMFAVARKGGIIRPIVVLIKSFASAICIATGGSVGQEGPIVQIGSGLGSTLAQWLRLPPERIRTCVACGAAAGIAATFNAPVAGCLFALEIILGDFAVGQFAPVVVSAVTSTVISRTLLGSAPLFVIPKYSLVSPWELVPYTALGILAGVLAVAFVIVLFSSEELWERTQLPVWLQPVLGGLLVGAIGIAVPEVFSRGYDSVTHALDGRLLATAMVLYVVSKLVATSLTLGAGGSGGIFAPSLFMGAMLGGAVGVAAQQLAWFPVAPPGAYALVGMGAVVAATTHGPITAIIILFELTNDYKIILPLMISCILSTLIATRIKKESIYTIKLARRGIDLSRGRELNLLRGVRVGEVMRQDYETVSRTASLEELYKRMMHSPHHDFFVVNDDGSLAGVVSTDDLSRALPDMSDLVGLAIADDVANHEIQALHESDTLDDAMRIFGARHLDELPVVTLQTRRPAGSLHKRDLIAAYNREILKADMVGAVGPRIEAAHRGRQMETVGEFVIEEMEAPHRLCGKSFGELSLRPTYGIQVILVRRMDAGDNGDGYEFPAADTVLAPGDCLLVLGKRDAVSRFRRG